MKIPPILPWLILPPAILLSWYLTFALALYTHRLLEKSLCPPAELISGFCHNPQVQQALTLLEYGFVSLSALIILLITHRLAPHHIRKSGAGCNTKLKALK